MQLEGQAGFAGALLDPEAPVPAGVVDPQGHVSPKRFAVYRNNVSVSLTEALTATFPAVAALVGEEFFKLMALEFIRKTPPTSPLLSEYGRDFPAFLENFEPVSKLPFLPDVARLDRAWLDSYNAADAKRLDPAVVAQISEDKLAATSFELQPATQILQSNFPVVSLWAAGRNGDATANIDPTTQETALIVRPEFDVSVHPLSPAEGIFFKNIEQTKPLSDAAEAAAEVDQNFDLARVLGLLIGTGACADLAH